MDGFSLFCLFPGLKTGRKKTILLPHAGSSPKKLDQLLGGEQTANNVKYEHEFYTLSSEDEPYGPGHIMAWHHI